MNAGDVRIEAIQFIAALTFCPRKIGVHKALALGKQPIALPLRLEVPRLSPIAKSYACPAIGCREITRY